MLNERTPAAAIDWEIDLQPLAQRLGSPAGLAGLAEAVPALQRPRVTDAASLQEFLAAYHSHLLVPVELPAVRAAYLHAARAESRELIALDVRLGGELLLKPFAGVSRQVGAAHLQRLRPLRDNRVVQRYLRAVESGQAGGWHMVVYGLTLSVFALPLRQTLLHYGVQTLTSFARAAGRSLDLDGAGTDEMLAPLLTTLPGVLDSILAAPDWLPHRARA